MAAAAGGLSERERLAALDRELVSLREYCQQAEMTPEQMRRALQPLVSAVNWSSARQIVRRVVGVLAVLVVLAAALALVGRTQTAQQTAHTYARIALVKLLPYWDWTGLHELPCLLENPMFESVSGHRTEDTCELCESLDELERLSNVSVAAFTENYLRQDRPVIVTDATHDWPLMEDHFDRHQLIQLFSEPRLADAEPCELQTNLKVRGDMHLLLSKMANPVVKKWFAQWDNCDKRAAKALRTLYRRPYFLPAMVDTSDSNWVLVSANYTGNVYKMLPMVSDMVWMAQVRGSSTVRLTPREPCGLDSGAPPACRELAETLHEGEILIFTDFLWMLEYLPGHGTDNVALGAGGFWE